VNKANAFAPIALAFNGAFSTPPEAAYMRTNIFHGSNNKLVRQKLYSG